MAGLYRNEKLGVGKHWRKVHRVGVGNAARKAFGTAAPQYRESPAARGQLQSALYVKR